jgi:hypothetical protein
MATILQLVGLADSPLDTALFEAVMVPIDVPLFLFVFEVDQAEHEYAGGAVGIVERSVDNARTYLDVQDSDGELAVMNLVISVPVHNLNLGVAFSNTYFS